MLFIAYINILNFPTNITGGKVEYIICIVHNLFMSCDPIGLYIGLLLANLCSLIKNSADEEINSSTKPASKNRYQSNRAFIIGRLKKLLPRMLFLDNDIGLMIDELISIASKYRSQIQPNRSTYRKKSNKGRTHFRNRKYTY